MSRAQPSHRNWLEKSILRREGMTVSFRLTCVAGSFVGECFHPNAPMPICTLWLRWEDTKKRTTLEILNCYVPERFRRLGLLTWTFDKTLKHFQTIKFVATDHGTEFSEPWLVKTGWRKHRKHGWIYKVGP